MVQKSLEGYDGPWISPGKPGVFGRGKYKGTNIPFSLQPSLIVRVSREGQGWNSRCLSCPESNLAPKRLEAILQALSNAQAYPNGAPEEGEGCPSSGRG